MLISDILPISRLIFFDLQQERGRCSSQLPFLDVRVQSIVLRTQAIDRFSCLRLQPTRALANQCAASYLRQSGRLSGHHAQAAKIRILFVQPHDTPEHDHLILISLKRLFFRNTLSPIIHQPLAIVPFWFGGIETWLGVVRRTIRSSQRHVNPFCIIQRSLRYTVMKLLFD